MVELHKINNEVDLKLFFDRTVYR